VQHRRAGASASKGALCIACAAPTFRPQLLGIAEQFDARIRQRLLESSPNGPRGAAMERGRRGQRGRLLWLISSLLEKPSF
jgi:hypothetical protein